MNTSEDADLRAQLDRIAAYEAGRRETVLTRIVRRVAPTRPFIAVYRRIGARIDPWINRVTKGAYATRVAGFPALTLVTTGAKTGRRRESSLFYVRDGDDFVVVGTNFGTEHHPAWTYNLRADPNAEIEVGGETVAVTAESVGDEDFERLWPGFTEFYEGYDAYRARLEREARMFALRPTARAAG